jgi:hypothetical protein
MNKDTKALLKELALLPIVQVIQGVAFCLLTNP